MAYQTTWPQRRIRLESISDTYMCEVLAELLNRVDLDAPTDEMSEAGKAALAEIRATFQPADAPRWDRGASVVVRDDPTKTPQVVELPQLGEPDDKGWLYALRDESEHDNIGDLFREDELVAVEDAA